MIHIKLFEDFLAESTCKECGSTLDKNRCKKCKPDYAPKRGDVKYAGAAFAKRGKRRISK
jgi:hypothetical protein